MTQALLDAAWLIPCYALVAWLGAFWWSAPRPTGPRPAGYINIILTFVALVHTLATLVILWDQPPLLLSLNWLQVANLNLVLPLQFSRLTLTACLLISGLNLAAQIFAVGYMETDWGWSRFFSLLGLFEGGMCALVLCDSLFFSYVILEILTLGTYLLVGFWYNQPLVVTGARDAFLTKRIGDLLLLMGVVAIYPLTGTWTFEGLVTWADQVRLGAVSVEPTVLTLVTLALLAAPIAKCAQFPLHSWLDEAMEGPMPATILRNTVVVATGAWVLIRLEPLLSLSPLTMTVMLAVGLSSAIGGSLIAIAQVDVKRVLSYLASAYMGLVFIATSLGQPDVAWHVLLSYALAMAVVIMAVGTVIWNSISQDLRLLGGLWSRRPLSGLSFLVGTAGLLLGTTWGLGEWLGQAGPVWVAIASGINALSGIALIRTFGLIWGGKTQQFTERSPEVFWPMVLPMIIVAGFTLHTPQLWASVDELPPLSPALGLVWAAGLAGAGATAALYLPAQRPSLPTSEALRQGLYVMPLYRKTIIACVDLFAKIAAWFDRTVVDGAVNLTSIAVIAGGELLKYTTTGQIQAYALTIVLAAVLVGWLAF